MSQLTWHDWRAQERQLTGHQNCGNCLSVADKAHAGGHEATRLEPIDARPVPVVAAASASGEKTRVAGPRLNECGMSALAARRPLDG